MDEYLAINRANWDERASAHAASPDYAVDQFIEDPAFLSEVVRFDRARLGAIKGLAGVHLQCHIGTDTVSLARLGAQMTGLDLSPSSLRGDPDARVESWARGDDLRRAGRRDAADRSR